MCVFFTAPPCFYGLFGTKLRLYRELQQLESQSNANRSSRRLWSRSIGIWEGGTERIWWSLPIFWKWKNGGGALGFFCLYFSVYLEKHMFFVAEKKLRLLFQAFLFRFWGDGCCKKIWGCWHDDRWHSIYFSQIPCDACGKYLYHCILMHLLCYIYLLIFILSPWVCPALTARTKHVATNFTRKYQEWWSWWPLRCKIRVELHGDSVDSSPLEGLSALPSWALRIIFVEFILMCESTVWVKLLLQNVLLIQDIHIYNNMHRDAHLYVYEAYMYDAYVRYVGLYISKWIESNTWPTPILSSKSSKGFPSIVWDWLSDGWKMIYVLLKWSIFRWHSFFFFGRDIHEYKMIFTNPSKFPWCYWTENWL